MGQPLCRAVPTPRVVVSTAGPRSRPVHTELNTVRNGAGDEPRPYRLMKRNRFVSSVQTTRTTARTPPMTPDRAAPASRATASWRSSTPRSRCSPRSATTGSRWTPWPRGPRRPRPPSTAAGTTRSSLVIDALLARQAGRRDEPRHRHPARRPDRRPSAALGGLDRPARRVATFGQRPDRDLPGTPEFAEAFRRDVLGPKIAVSSVIFERARDRGEIHADVGPRRCSPRPSRGSSCTASSSG